jgi:hypothetical protein
VPSASVEAAPPAALSPTAPLRRSWLVLAGLALLALAVAGAVALRG